MLSVNTSVYMEYILETGLPVYITTSLVRGKWWWREVDFFWLDFGDYIYETACSLKLCFPPIRLLKQVIDDVCHREDVLLTELYPLLVQYQDHTISISLLSHAPCCSLFHLFFYKGQFCAVLDLLAFVDNRDVAVMFLSGSTPKLPRGLQELLTEGQWDVPYEPMFTILKGLRGIPEVARWRELLEHEGNRVYPIILPDWISDEIRFQEVLFGDVDPKLFPLDGDKRQLFSFYDPSSDKVR